MYLFKQLVFDDLHCDYGTAHDDLAGTPKGQRLPSANPLHCSHSVPYLALFPAIYFRLIIIALGRSFLVAVMTGAVTARSNPISRDRRCILSLGHHDISFPRSLPPTDETETRERIAWPTRQLIRLVGVPIRGGTTVHTRHDSPDNDCPARVCVLAVRPAVERSRRPADKDQEDDQRGALRS